MSSVECYLGQRNQFNPQKSTLGNSTVRIYLTGFMASGKSTVGPRVAERLGIDFCDLDDWVEAQAGRPISAIFEAEGEPAFRRLEAEALRATVQRDDVVVALGGGALVDVENLAFAKKHGTVVYLQVPAEELIRRLSSEADTRPLLQDEEGVPLPDRALRARIESMLVRRRRFYEQAHVTVDAAQPVDDVVAAMVRRVEAWERGREGERESG